MSTRPAVTTVIRDLSLWVGGWIIIFKQAGIVFAPPSQVNETLVWVAAALIGGPGIAQLLTWRTGTAGSSSQPAPPPLPSSPTPSTTPPAEGERA